jgi:nicotinamide mononucleotide adenylyltransferase
MLLAAVFAASLVFVSCASNSKPVPAESASAKDLDLPDWYMNPPDDEDVIIGIGSAKMSDVNNAFGAAEQRARVSISRTLKDNIKAMVTDYSRTAGTADESTTLQFYESISQSVTNNTLSGAKVAKRDYKSGVAYVMVTMSKADAAAAGASVIENEASQYAEFKAMNALALLNAQLESDNAVQATAQDN